MESNFLSESADFLLAYLNILVFLPRIRTLNKYKMSVFGIVLFLLIFGMAFWMLLFLMGFVLPFWITLGVFEKLRPKRIFEEAEEH